MTSSYLFTPPSSPSSSASLPNGLIAQERPLSANELSYFLPSRANGVNDMYLHHHLTTSTPSLFYQDRIAIIWAILRGRHPLLASHVIFSGEDKQWQFRHQPPSSPSQAITLALNSLAFPDSPGLSSTDLISTYLNGPRLLSPLQLSFLVLSSSQQDNNNAEFEFDFLLCTTHFVGDGIALHTLANEFYGLVSAAGGEEGAVEPRTKEELREVLEREMREREVEGRMGLPLSTETLFAAGKQGSVVNRAASKLALERSQRRAIGSQTLPRSKPSSTTEVCTIVPTISYPVDETKRILAKCKKEGVSVSNAVFGLVGVAWARLLESGRVKGKVEEPLLLYSALSLRGLLPPTPPSTPAQSYFHLSLGYYTITLPSFLPPSSITTTTSSSSVAQSFWHRSRSTKTQTLVHLKSKLLVGKASAEAEQRREKAVKWAKEDDRVEMERERKMQEDEEMKRNEVGGGEGLFGLGFGLNVEQEEGARFGAGYRKERVSDPLAITMREMKIVDDEGEPPAMSTPPTTPGRVDISTFANAQTLLPSKHTNTNTTNNSTLLLTPPTTPRAPTQAQPLPLKPTSSSPPPTSPLLGLSLLGNLDAIYTHSTYSPHLTLTALTTGSRQRQGAALLFSYTFQKKLWLSLGWDEAGFGEEGREAVQGLWEGLNAGVEEFLDC